LEAGRLVAGESKAILADPGQRPAQHLCQWEERRRAIVGAADKARQARDMLARHGIERPTVTGTFEFETASGV